MRILAGRFKGKIIKTSKNSRIRASSSKLRESLFGILGEKIISANFLDLFAGTGSIALEAYSRGEGEVTCVENNPEALFILMRNIKDLDLLFKIKVKRIDVFKFLKSSDCGKYDIIFLDPPYGEISLANKALYEISSNNILKSKGIIIAEHYHKHQPKEKLGDLVLFDLRKYGQTALSFYKEVTSDA